ncbi:transposase [Xenorhabdus griffiniae]|uniref:transposase n=1 Tax=Xenorhabdus griffiniae TaxID=351672 RepID=UPI00235A41E4|nr:transposase [Xenorhabdus griffiniae]MDC9605098.1 transposase [Xenorhabdus griffiniae]
MKRKAPPKFTVSFKREAVNLVVEQDHTVPLAAGAYSTVMISPPIEYEMAFVKRPDFS